MSQEQKPTEPIILNRKEMLALMNLMGVHSLVGVELQDESVQKDLKVLSAKGKSILGSLAERGFLRSVGGKFEIHPDFLPAFSAVMLPERAMMVVRDLPSAGKQLLLFLYKNGTTVLHSFPEERKHRLETFNPPEKIAGLLMNWFPLQICPPSPAAFRISRDTLEKVRSAAEIKNTQHALEELRDVNIPAEEKQEFVDTIMNRKTSGAFAVLFLESGEAVDASSFSAFADEKAAWLISGEDEQEAKDAPTVLLQRVSADFVVKIHALITLLTGSAVSIAKTGEKGNITRYLLGVDDLARAFAAINCPHVAMDYLTAAYREIRGDQIQARSESAVRNLVERKLFVLPSEGRPAPVDELQYALLPPVHFDFMLRLTVLREKIKVAARVFVLRGKSFTAVFEHGPTLFSLETGAYDDLTGYLGGMYPEFGSAPKDAQPDIGSVSLETLNRAVEGGDPNTVAAAIDQEGLKQPYGRMLADDIAHMIFRGTLLRYEPAAKDAKGIRAVSESSAKLILKGPQGQWLFDFPTVEPKSKGTVNLVDRAGFERALAELTK